MEDRTRNKDGEMAIVIIVSAATALALQLLYKACDKRDERRRDRGREDRVEMAYEPMPDSVPAPLQLLPAGVGDARGHDDDVGPGLVVDDLKRIDEAGALEVNEAQGVAPREPSLLPGPADAAEKFNGIF